MKRTSIAIVMLIASASAGAAVTCDTVKRTSCTGPANELIAETRIGVEWDGGTGSWMVYGYVLPSTSTVLNTLNCGGSPKMVTLSQANWPTAANQMHASILQAIALNRTISLTVAAGSGDCTLRTVAVKGY